MVSSFDKKVIRFQQLWLPDYPVTYWTEVKGNLYTQSRWWCFQRPSTSIWTLYIYIYIKNGLASPRQPTFFRSSIWSHLPTHLTSTLGVETSKTRPELQAKQWSFRCHVYTYNLHHFPPIFFCFETFKANQNVVFSGPCCSNRLWDIPSLGSSVR